MIFITRDDRDDGMANARANGGAAEKARVRYMVNAIDSAVAFYTEHLGFDVKPGATPNFAMLSRGNLELVLSTPFGPGGAAKPMADGRKAEPGGWNRIILSVKDLPSGNPVELFQASRG
jgi:hypothetical protein